MTIQPGAMLYTQGFGSRPENVEVPHIEARAPTSSDVNYPLGKVWVDTLDQAAYTLVALSTTTGITTATWATTGGGSGAVATLTADTGSTVSPSAGNIKIAGTANQITTTGSAATVTLSLPSAITAPGSLTTTTTLAAGTTMTAGTGITSTTGNIVATAGAVNAGTTMTAGTGITATTGNIVATAGAVNSGTTMTAGTGITATTGNIVATAGAVNAGTSMTATLGNITATNGNLAMGTIGNKIIVPTGTNASAGTSAVMSGTPGAVTVATTASSATAKIFYCRNVTGGTPGEVSITAQDGTGFTLTSTANETSTFNWWIINA